MMDKSQEISSRLWTVFKSFISKKKTDKNWEVFLSQMNEIVEQYQGAEKKLAQDMALAFICFIETKEKEVNREHMNQEAR